MKATDEAFMDRALVLADYTTESMLKLTGRSIALEFGIRAEACEAARRRPFGKKK